MIRELHVYGTVVPIHSRNPSKFQHQVIILIFWLILKGYGTMLMEEAEKIAINEHGS